MVDTTNVQTDYLKTEGVFTYGAVNKSDLDANTIQYLNESEKHDFLDDGTLVFKDDDGSTQAVPVSIDKANVDISAIDPELIQKAADLTYLSQNGGVKTSDMNALYLELGLDPNDSQNYVKKDAILKAAGYKPGEQVGFYGNNSAQDVSAQILHERNQQQPTEQDMIDAGIDPSKVSIVNSGSAAQAYLNEELAKRGIDQSQTMAYVRNVSRADVRRSDREIEKLIGSSGTNPSNYWASRIDDAGSFDDATLNMLEWDLIKKKAEEKRGTVGTGGDGFSGTYTGVGGGGGSTYTGGGGGTYTGVGTSGFTSTPTMPGGGTIYPEGMTGLSEVTVPTFNENLNLQQQQFETRAEEQNKLYQPQTLAEKQAAGDTRAFENVLYRNRFGMTMYVQHINGKPSQPIPPGYYRVEGFGTPDSQVQANKGGLMGYAPGGVVQQQGRTNLFSPELTKTMEDFQNSPLLQKGQQASKALQDRILKELGIGPNVRPSIEQMEQFNQMFNAASANDPDIQAMQSSIQQFQQQLNNNPEYQAYKESQEKNFQQQLQAQAAQANLQQTGTTNGAMTQAQQQNINMMQAAQSAQPQTEEQKINAANAAEAARLNAAVGNQIQPNSPQAQLLAAGQQFDSTAQVAEQMQQFGALPGETSGGTLPQAQAADTSGFTSTPTTFDPGTYNQPQATSAPGYTTPDISTFQTQSNPSALTVVEGDAPEGSNNNQTLADTSNQTGTDTTGTGTGTGTETTQPADNPTANVSTGDTSGGTLPAETFTLDEAGLAQAQQDLVAQATAAPGGAVAAAPVSYIDKNAEGSVIESTAGQALPTAPMVTGDQLAQVGTATVADVPQNPGVAQVNANLATDQIQNVVDQTQAATSTGPTKTIEAAQADGSSVSGLTAATGESIDVTGAPTRKVEEGEMITGTGVDQTKVGEAFGTGEVQAASVQDELTGLMQQFEGGNTPPWAAGAMRNATAMLAARGLSASSMAGQAVIQAAMESALPIAQIDASNKQEVALFKAQKRAEFLQQDFDQAFQAKVANAAKVSEIANMNFTAQQQIALENSKAANTMALQNLSNEQALVMAEAAALSQLDLANLSNNQQAAVQNAQNFLQIDMANLANEQQTALFKSQSLQNSILSDQAASNAAQQFNASSINQSNQFMANLASSINQFNAAQINAMKQFNADEANSMLEFNANMQNQREMFNAQNYLVVAQANAQWRQNVDTINTAAANQSNMDYAQTVNALTAKVLDQIWQRERDIMDYSFTQSENSADRALSILLGDKQLDAIQKQLDAAEQEALGGLLTKIFFTSDTSEPYSTDTDEEE